MGGKCASQTCMAAALLLHLLPLWLGFPASCRALSVSTPTFQPPISDIKSFERCRNDVRRAFKWLDRDGDGHVSDREVSESEVLSAIGLQQSDRADLVEGCYHASRMSTEDVQIYLSRCAKNDMFLAHFSGIDGAEMFGRLLDPAMSERAMRYMLIPARDRVHLRRHLFKSLLKADRAHILSREMHAQTLVPRVTDIKSRQLTVHLPENPEARGFKVQYCQENDGKAAGANATKGTTASGH